MVRSIILSFNVEDVDVDLFRTVVRANGCDAPEVINVHTGYAEYLAKKIGWLSRDRLGVQFTQAEAFLLKRDHQPHEAQGYCRRLIADAILDTFQVDTAEIGFVLADDIAPWFVQLTVSYVDKYFPGIGGVILGSSGSHRIAKELVESPG